MKIALFADIHGKILLPFKLVDLYQKETGEVIDLILQCGDIGAFPDLDNLDKATIRHAKKDRDELGFHDDFVVVKPTIKAFLEELNIDMICVRGNHEDHDFLDELEKQHPNESLFPIDVYQKVFVCKTGFVQHFEKDDDELLFIGIGRIGDRKGRKDEKFIQDYERRQLKKLIKSNGMYDLLITHDKDDMSERGYGSAEIREVLDNIIFQYHFYGHTGQPFNIETDYNGITQSVKIKELEFNHSGVLPKGCMIILTKKSDSIELEVIEQRLTNQLTKFNWHY